MQNDFLTPYKEDSGVPPYLPFPRFLVPMDLSNDAKVLYALLLDRAGISRENGYIEPDGRIAGDVFPGFPAHFDNCPDFFACVLGVIVVKYVFEHSEVIFALCTVHIIIDGDKPDIVGREDEILQPPHIRILPAQT